MSDNMLPNETPIIIEMTPEGKDGLDGVSVVGFGMISHVGKVKTYRFTLSNGEFFDFSVADGEDPVLEWGNITGTLTDQTDLSEALTAIRTALASKAEASDVYDKATIDSLLSAIDTAIGQKANADAVYTKTEADALLDGKADTGDSYTKSEDDALLAQKANSADVYTKTEVDAEIDDINSAIDGIGTALTSKADASDLTALANRVSADEQTIASKADASSVYTKIEADALLAQKADTADVTSALAQKADADDLADAVADIADLALNKAPAITETASGAMVTIEDGAEAPVKALTVGIEPVQDLHGYDAPWPAGGGKNLCYIEDFTTTVNGLTFTAVDNILTINGTSTGSIGANNAVWKHIRFNILVEGSYARSVAESLPSGFNMASYALSDNTPYASVVSTYPIGEYYIGIYIPANTTANNLKIQFQIESGSAVTSFAPYANICPITGHTQAVVTRTGKNLFDVSATSTENGFVENKYVNSSGILVSDTDCNVSEYISAKPNVQYVINPVSGSNVSVAFYDSNKTFISATNYGITWGTYGSKTFTTPANVKFIRLSIIKIKQNETQLELGSTATDYEPYSGTILNITFPTESGTVYGGTVDVTNRVLTVDRAMHTFNGTDTYKSSSWRRSETSFGFYFPWSLTQNALSRAGQLDAFIISDKLQTRKYDDLYNMTVDWGVCVYSNTSNDIGIIMRIGEPSITTASALSAWLAENPVTVVYELYTPITYTLTESEISDILSTLYGTNHIWSDTGDVSLEYRADTKLYIDNAIAKSQTATRSLITGIEASMVATQNYTSGALIIVGDDLYKATANIASGGTLTVGTNVSKITLAQYILEQLQ